MDYPDTFTYDYPDAFTYSSHVFEDETPIPNLSKFMDLYSPAELSSIVNDPDFAAFAALYPEDAAALSAGVDTSINAAESTKLTRQGDLAKQGDNPLKNVGPGGVDKDPITLKSVLDSIKQGVKDFTGFEAGDVFQAATMAALANMAYRDAKEAREMQRGYIAKAGDVPRMQAVRGSDGSVGFRAAAAEGGLMSVVGMVDPIGTMQRVLTDPRTQQKFEGYLIKELQQRGYADGGVARYFAGGTDGMADQIPAQIENQRPAALSDGEFVIPADVVSHLGNGNSTAGAKRLYEMMDRIREARTGTTKQGRQIDANDFMPG